MSETNEKRAREEDEEPVEDDPAEPTKKAKEDAEEAPEETPEAAPAAAPAAPAEKKDERTFTPVVFLGHLPLNGVEDEVLVNLAKPWSPVLQIVTIDGKGQAFLQLKDADATRAMVQYYDQTPATIDGHGPIYVNPAHHATLSGGRLPGETPKVDTGEPSKILLIKIQNARHPITAQVMNTVLTMHAPVLRIVVFKKQDTKIERLQNHMCLAEFESVEHATLALTNLQGQNIYAGCCKMVIQYSSQRDSLQIQRNSEYSHDYTRPDEPGNFILGAQPQQSYAPNPYAAAPQYPIVHDAYGGGMPQASGSRVVFVKNLNEQQVTPEILFRLFSVYGDVEKLKILWEKRSNAMVQFTDRQGAVNAIANLQNVELFGRNLKLSEFSHGEVNVGADNKGEMAAYYGHNHPEHRFARANNPPNFGPPSEKLFLASIPLSWDEHKLRSFLSPAGRIVEMKMLPPKKFQSAIVVMASVQEAINVLTMFHWATVDTNIPSAQGAHDLNLRVNFSTSKRDNNNAGGAYAPQNAYQTGFPPQSFPGYPPQLQQPPPYYDPSRGASQQQQYYPQHQQHQQPQHQGYGHQGGGYQPEQMYQPPAQHQQQHHHQQGHANPALTTATFQQQQQQPPQQQQQHHHQQQQQQQQPPYSQGYGSFLK